MSRRKKREGQSKKERRPIEPMIHSASVRPGGKTGNFVSMPASLGIAAGMSAITRSSHGIYFTAITAAPTSMDVHPDYDITPVMREAIVRRSVTRRGDPPLEARPAELDLGRLIALAKSLDTGTDHTAISPDVQDDDTDVQIENSAGAIQDYQVTRAQPADSWEIKQGEEYTTSHSIDQVAAEILNAIERKSGRYGRSDLALILDGYCVALSPQVLLRVYLDWRSQLENSEFAEIWYASMHPQQAVRLSPTFMEGKVKQPSNK